MCERTQSKIPGDLGLGCWEPKIKDEIKEFFQQVSKLAGSPENKRRKEMWGPEFSPDEYEPGLIAPFPACKRKEKRPPITADWDRLQWSKLLHFDIKKYYTNPLAYLKWTLEVDIYRFKNFPDDTPLTKIVPIFLGAAYEPNLFGVPIVYSSAHEPLFTSEGSVIKSKSDLAKLKTPNFFKTGLMPLAHKFYEEINKLVPEDFSVIFPKWGRGPFGIACAVRGMQRLLIDMIEDSKFVHQLMRFVTDSRKEYTRRRRKFTGKNEVESTCWNDEVSIPIISPQLYEEFIFPYEDELSKFYGGIKWWHSCGNKTPLISIIRKINQPIGFMDFGLWTDDLQTSVRDLNSKIPFHVRPNSRDISERSEDIIKNHIQGIMCICNKQNFVLRLDAFQPDDPKETDVNAMKKYLSIAKKVGEKNLRYYVGSQKLKQNGTSQRS